jgi:hypothetical protein
LCAIAVPSVNALFIGAFASPSASLPDGKVFVTELANEAQVVVASHDRPWHESSKVSELAACSRNDRRVIPWETVVLICSPVSVVGVAHAFH